MTSWRKFRNSSAAKRGALPRTSGSESRLAEKLRRTLGKGAVRDTILLPTAGAPVSGPARLGRCLPFFHGWPGRRPALRTLCRLETGAPDALPVGNRRSGGWRKNLVAHPKGRGKTDSSGAERVGDYIAPMLASGQQVESNDSHWYCKPAGVGLRPARQAWKAGEKGFTSAAKASSPTHEAFAFAKADFAHMALAFTLATEDFTCFDMRFSSAHESFSSVREDASPAREKSSHRCEKASREHDNTPFAEAWTSFRED